ncbi:beta strand repeat-containing protein [Bradyrhizobium sp. AZCC 2289]|uniref:beta strand repeat-containing protein n=1 Tax=Bradyrhizobium sp. AZCC 2289 TaxID=3117026 RepID=UPI002FF13746
MATYKYDATTNTYILVDDSMLLSSDPSLTTNISVTTDLPDYAPGSTAAFTASVGVGDTVTFNVTDVAGTAVSGTNAPWTITDGGVGDLDGVANGVIQTSWTVGQDAAGESFVLSATDQTAGLMATTAFTDSAPHIPVPAVVPATLTNGIVFLTGDTHTATGTGIFPSFVQIQANPQEGGVEQGFNTDAAPVEDTGSSSVHNHSLLLSAVPIVTVNGVDYREFRLDLNETDKPITLDTLQIYKAAAGDLTSLAGLTQIYDMDGGPDGLSATPGDNVNVSVQLTAWSSGSGHSDYKILIPDSYFSGTDPSAFIYLNSEFSNADAGFEEWSVAAPAGGGPGGQGALTILKIVHDVNLDTQNLVVDHAGDVINYNIELGNTGTAGLTVTAVTDQVESFGVTNAIPTLSGAFNSGDANHNNILDPGEHWEYTASYTVIQADLDHDGYGTPIGGAPGDGFIDNLATASATGVPDATSTAFVPIVFDPSLTITKVASTTPTDLLDVNQADHTGQVINYTIEVDNTGNIDLTGVTLTDTSFADSGATRGADIVGNNDNILDVGEKWSFTASHTVTQAEMNAGANLVNTATVDTAQTAPQDATATTVVDQDPSLTITKVASTTPTDLLDMNQADHAGQVINYTIEIDNTGNIDLTGVTLADTSFADSGATRGADIVGNNDNILDVGEKWSFTASHTVTQAEMNAGADLVNTATVDTAQTAPQDATATTVVDQDPSLTITKVASTTPTDLLDVNQADHAGQVINYTIEVDNTGNIDLTGVTLTDTSFADSGATRGADIVGNNDNILDVGEKWSFTASHTVTQAEMNAGADLVNTATVDTTQTAPQDATATTVVDQDPSIHIEKVTTGFDGTANHTGDGISILAGSGVTWTYTVTNDGNVDLSNIAVTDSKGVTPVYVSGDTNGDHILETTETWVYKATGTAVLGGYNNTGTATGHLGSSTVSDDDGSSYTGTFTEQGGTLTQGFWGSHTDAWDGVNGKESNPTTSAFKSGVLSKLEINPRHDGNLLLGDSNGDGIANDAHDLLISDKLAAAIESSSTSGDARMIMLQQAIATQLNIDNGKAEPNNLIDEAVMWLTKAAPGAWSGVGVNIAASGLVDDGHGNLTLVVAENAGHTALAGSAVATSSSAWHGFVNVTDAAGYVGTPVTADGEGLKNALMWWNDGHLVTTAAGQVAYDPDGTGSGGVNPATIHLNTTDEFWLTLHQQTGLTGIG